VLDTVAALLLRADKASDAVKSGLPKPRRPGAQVGPHLLQIGALVQEPRRQRTDALDHRLDIGAGGISAVARHVDLATGSWNVRTALVASLRQSQA